MAEETTKCGGGSGGGGSSADRTETAKGTYGIKANSVQVLCMPPIPPGHSGSQCHHTRCNGPGNGRFGQRVWEPGSTGDRGTAHASPRGFGFDERG